MNAATDYQFARVFFALVIAAVCITAIVRYSNPPPRPDLALGSAVVEKMKETERCISQVESFRHDPTTTPLRPGTIFVSIASYRDDECKDTVFELFEKARVASRVFVGVVQQNKTGEEDCFDRCEVCRARKQSGQIRQIDFDFTQARGPCFARFYASKLWRGEEMFFMIDSHTRFEEGWDERLFEEFSNTGDPDAVLGAYPPTESQMEEFKQNDFRQTIMMCTGKWDDQDGLPNFLAAIVDAPEDKKTPIPHPLVPGGSLIMPGRALFSVPFDPYLNFLFFGEELLLSARLYTSGFNLYAIRRPFVVHNYGRGDKPKFWNDLGNFEACRKKAVTRARYILGLDRRLESVDPEYRVDIDEYGMGSKRTIAEYFEFAKVVLEKKEVRSACSADGYR